MKLDQVIEEMQKTWGPLPIRSMDDAVSCFDHALQKVFSALPPRNMMGRAVAGLLVDGLRERNLKSGDHASLTEITDILKAHSDKGTSLYVFNGYWAHHAPKEHCSGDDTDYCEHHVYETAETHSAFADASHHAWGFLNDHMIEDCPNETTNARVSIQLFDGDHMIPLGEWQWDKLFSRLWWANAQRN